MDEVEPRDLEQLLAEAWIAGDGQSWHQVAWICTRIHNSLMIVTKKLLGQESVTAKDFKEVEDGMPNHVAGRKVKSQPRQPRAMKAPETKTDPNQPTSLERWMMSMAGF